MHYSHVLLDMNSTSQYQGNFKFFTLVRKELNKELKTVVQLWSPHSTLTCGSTYYAVDDF